MAEDTNRASRWRSKGWVVMAAPEAELEDKAVGRQHMTKASVSAYSDLTASSLVLFLFHSLPMPAAQGGDAEKFKKPMTRMMGSPVSPRSGAPDA